MREDYRNQLYVEGLKLLHIAVTIVIFYYSWLFFRYGGFIQSHGSGFRYNYYITAGFAVLVLFFNRTYNSYLLGYSRIRTLVFSQFLSQLFSTGILWFTVCFAWRHWRAPWPFLSSLLLQISLDAVWSYFGNRIYFILNKPKRTIFIYRDNLDKKRFGNIKGKPTERLYKVEEEIQYEGNSFLEIQDKLEAYDAVFVAGLQSECRDGIAKYCKKKGIIGFFLPSVGDVIMREAKHIQTFDVPVLFITKSRLNLEYGIVKRAFDITAALAGVILFSPLMMATAAVIKLYDGGPAIYRQVRLTKDGKHFTILKFRSMRVDAEKDGKATLSTGERDSRITPVGRIIRKCRLDELPQLFNILRGDMSFVGPRPERPEIAEYYYKTLPDFHLRLQVKAGLTGYAQVYGKYNTAPREKLKFDLLYINDMGIVTDLRLIFATFGILIKKESTEGITNGQITAEDYAEKSLNNIDHT